LILKEGRGVILLSFTIQKKVKGERLKAKGKRINIIHSLKDIGLGQVKEWKNKDVLANIILDNDCIDVIVKSLSNCHSCESRSPEVFEFTGFPFSRE